MIILKLKKNKIKVIKNYFTKSNKAKHFNKCRKYEKELLNFVVKNLNKIHGTSLTRRQWQIILGPWLRRFVEVNYNRYHQLLCAIKFKNINRFYLLKSNIKLNTYNSKLFVLNAQNSLWNDKLNYEILKFLKLEKKIHFINKKYLFKKEKNNLIQNIQIKIKEFIYSFFNFFYFNDDIFLIDSYLPPIKEFLFQVFYLKQIPKKWNSVRSQNYKENSSLRKKCESNIISNSNKNFSFFLKKVFFKIIPTIYLEGFKETYHQTKVVRWPEKPKAIFTANAFEFNEFFKFWVARKITKNLKYICAQHGTNYNVTKYYVNPSVEEITSDKFFTWGLKKTKNK